jgi:hypothetical protein
MAITTLDGVIAGQKPMKFWHQGQPAVNLTNQRWYTTWNMIGIPGVGVLDTNGLAGSTLSNSGGPVQGSVPFTDPVGGALTYLARAGGSGNGANYPVMILDRLWHNSSVAINTTSPQTVNSVTWPARDENGTTDGLGVFILVEVSAINGAGTPTISISYTNSDGVAGRTGTATAAHATTAVKNTVDIIGLQAGDFGVRSIQTVTLSSTIASGTINLVAYRVLGMIDVHRASAWNIFDPVTGGMVRMYDGTVPFFMILGNNTVQGPSGFISYVQG